MVKVYRDEFGVLLPKNHDEYDSYSHCWDRQNGYYDEGHSFYLTKAEAERAGRFYVDEGVPYTYVIITVADVDLDDESLKYIKESAYFDGDIYEWLEPDNYVFSLYKDEAGRYYENFVRGKYVE